MGRRALVPFPAGAHGPVQRGEVPGPRATRPLCPLRTWPAVSVHMLDAQVPQEDRGGWTCVPVETQQGLLALKSPPRHPGEKREASMEVQTRCGHLHLAQNSDLSPVLSGPRTPCFCYGSPRSPGPSGPPGVPELLLGSSCQIPLPAPRPPEAVAWPCVGGQGKATTLGCGEDTVLGGDLPCVDLRQHGAQCGAVAPEPTGKTLALPFALL